MKHPFYKIVFWQLLIVIGFAFIVLMLQGTQKSNSTLLGGLAYWLPTSLFVWRVAKHNRARAAMRFIVSFLTGEIFKLILSGILFVMIIKYFPANIVFSLVGFVVAIIAFWLVAFTFLYREGVSA